MVERKKYKNTSWLRFDRNGGNGPEKLLLLSLLIITKKNQSDIYVCVYV